MQKEYTEQQMQEYRTLYDRIVGASERIDASEDPFRKRLVMRLLAEDIPAYEALPEDVRETFKIDLESLVQKLSGMLQ